MKAMNVPPKDPPKDITTWMSGTAVARTRMANTINVVTLARWLGHTFFGKVPKTRMQIDMQH